MPLLDRRHLLLAALALPAGCVINDLPPIATTPLPPPGASPLPRAPAVGQNWTYRQLNVFNSVALARVRETVASVGSAIEIAREQIDGRALPAERHAAWGQLLRDPAWDYPLNFEAPVPLWPATLSVGAQGEVQTRYLMDGGSLSDWIEVLSVVRGWERVTVPAGGFDTVRVERRLRLQRPEQNFPDTVRRDVLWLAPAVGRWVARETSGETFDEGGGPGFPRVWQEAHVRWELTAWQ